MRSAADSIATYIRAKDGNRPALMRDAFAEDATLEMVVNAGSISFPPLTRGLASIMEVLVTRFGEIFEDVHTFCLAQPPKASDVAFSCPWLVGMAEKATRAVRVGCGSYDWTFRSEGARVVQRLRITVDLMEVLPSRDRTAVMDWLSALPYPWCDARTVLGRAPALDGLEPVLRYLNRTIPAAAVRG